MAEYKNTYLTDKTTGQLYVVGQTGDPVPIEPADIAELEASSLSQVGSAAGRGIKTIAHGAASLAGVEGQGGVLAELDRQGGVQGSVNSIQQLGQYIPDVAAGIATGGGSIPAQLGKAAVVEGMLGAARNPDNPVQGALVQGGLGVAGAGAGAVLAPVVIGGIRVGTKAGNKLSSRFNQVAETVVNKSRARAASSDSVGAARNVAPEFSTQGRILKGQNTTAQMDELALDIGMDEGSLYTKGMGGQLDATTDAEMAAATALREREELYSSNVLLDRSSGKSTLGVKDKLNEASTKVVMSELGENIESRMTWQNMQQLEKEIVQPFKDAQEMAGPIKLTKADTSELEDVITYAEMNDQALAKKYITDIQEDIIKNGGELSAKDAQQIRTRLGKDINNAASNGQIARVGSLSDLKDVLDNAMERNLDAETLEALTDARHKYRVLKAVQSSTATTSPDGKVNIKSLVNAWQRSGKNRYGRLAKKAEKFNRNIETLNNLQAGITPSSGTAQRLLVGAANNKIALGGAAVASGLGLLGD